MQSLSWQLWRLWGNVEKNSPLRGLCPRLSTAPLHSTLPAGPVWGGSCNLTWFPSFHWETTRCSSCQLSHLCSRPSGRGAQPPATWALIPRALKVPSSHWAFYPHPQGPAVCPLEPMRCDQQAPCVPSFISEPHLVILTQWLESILATGNDSCQNDWMLLLPGGRICCNEHNSPSQGGVALYPARWAFNLGNRL